jgi:hypothetical protein
MSTICMKLDPGIHIGMHLVCFSKTRCDIAHPSNTAARRILVTFSFHVAVSGVGSPEPHGIRMNNFILCPMIIVFRMNNPSSFVE